MYYTIKETFDLILPYTDACIALYTQCFPSVCEKNFTGDSGGIRTHNLLLSADILTSQPPSLPDDDIYRLVNLLSLKLMKISI